MTRRWVRALVIILMLVVGAGAAAVVVTQTAWFRDWLRGYIVKQANENLNGRLAIGRLGGSLFYGVELENVALTIDGREAVRIRNIGVKYNALQMITKGISIEQLRVDQPVVHLWRSGDSWAIAKVVKKERQEADRSGPKRPIALEAIGISNGTIVIDDAAAAQRMHVPSRFERLDARVAFHYEPVRYSVDITHVSFRRSNPDLALNSLSGGVAVRNDALYLDRLAVRTSESVLTVDGAIQNYLSTPVLQVKVASEKLSMPELASVLPALKGRPLTPAFTLALDGPLSGLKVALHLSSSAGEGWARLVADVDGPQQSAKGDVEVRHLDLAPILADKSQKSDLTVTAKTDLQGPALSQFAQLSGSVTFSGPHVGIAGIAADGVNGSAKLARGTMTIDTRARMYGAGVTAAGQLVLPVKGQPLAYDMRGRVRGLDLRKLPRTLKAPPAPTNLSADYHAVGRGGRSVNVQANLLDSVIADARIMAPSTGSFALDGGKIDYAADANIAELDLQRIGRAFKVNALDSDRYKSALNGHIVAKGSGTSAADLNIAANGTLTDSSIGSGRIEHLTFDTTFGGDALHVTASGAFADLDPAG